MNVTMNILNIRLALLNKALGRNFVKLESTDAGVRFNIGNLHIDRSYGGVRVVEVSNESGGVRNALGMSGVTSKRACLDADVENEDYSRFYDALVRLGVAEEIEATKVQS